MADDGAQGLLEREAELDLIARLVDAAREGRGSTLFVEAPAGHGKTALLRALRRRAPADVGVLTAVGSELERDVAFGIVRQLFESAVREAGGERPGEPFRGAAVHARPVFEDLERSAVADDAAHVRLHGLFWLTANLADRRPLALVVDDAHWADPPSLRFLEALARRVEDLPVLVAVATRPGEPGAEQHLLDAIATGPAVHHLRPGGLSRASVGRMVGTALPCEVEPAFVDACLEVTRGTPFMVGELVRTLASGGYEGRADEADAVRLAVPGTITRSVVARLRRLSPDALAVARALALLGTWARLETVSRLAEVAPPRAGEALDVLARVGLLEPDAPRFVHPLVRQAVRADLIGAECARWHARTATVLRESGAPDQLVAVHLLQAEPAGDPVAARILTATGARALGEGAPDVAARHLRRALEELGDPVDPETLLLAGRAEIALGDPAGLELLERAAASQDVDVAIRATQARTPVLIMAERRDEAIDGLLGLIDRVRVAAPERVAELEEDLLVTVQYHPRHLERRRAILQAAAGQQRLSHLALTACDRALEGAPAEEVTSLALRALAGGELLRSRGASRSTFHCAVEALMTVEAADEARAAAEAAAQEAHRSGSHLAAAYVAALRTAWERLFGDLRRAEDEARRALELFRAPGVEPGTLPTLPSLAAALLDRGDVEEAERVLGRAPRGGASPSSLYVRDPVVTAQLRLAQGRPEEAAELLERHAGVLRRRGWVLSPRDDVAALRIAALVAAGRHEEARALAERERELARRRGAPGAEASVLLAVSRAVPPAEALDLLEAAEPLARRSPRLGVRAGVLAELGAARRRSGRRSAAREPLLEARELAHRIGAGGLEARVLEELIVAGARPRRVALAGVDALTASERRVAELAAQGMRNRDIAETLFVTVKTVEVHLGHVYGKLDIKGRAQLAAALGDRLPTAA